MAAPQKCRNHDRDLDASDAGQKGGDNGTAAGQRNPAGALRLFQGEGSIGWQSSLFQALATGPDSRGCCCLVLSLLSSDPCGPGNTHRPQKVAPNSPGAI